LLETPYLGSEDGAMEDKKKGSPPTRYPDELKQRAVKMVLELRAEDPFTRQPYAQKCDSVYQHVFDSYWDDGRSVYQLAS
jgi:hypothetical protein